MALSTDLHLQYAAQLLQTCAALGERSELECLCRESICHIEERVCAVLEQWKQLHCNEATTPPALLAHRLKQLVETHARGSAIDWQQVGNVALYVFAGVGIAVSWSVLMCCCFVWNDKSDKRN